MPDQKVVLRDFIPDDCKRLPGLLEDVWAFSQTEAYWKWKYVDPPFGTRGWCVENEDGHLVAFTGFWSRPLKMGRYQTFPVMLADVMAAGAYRGGGAYSLILNEINNLIRETPVFGFTNPISHKLFKQSLTKYVKIDSAIPIYTSIIHAGYLVPYHRRVKHIIDKMTRMIHRIRLLFSSGRRVSVRQTDRIDDAFDYLWTEVSEEYTCIQHRGKEYLDWRYMSGIGRKYQVWKAEEYGRLVGYMVTTVSVEPERTRGFIVDWLVSQKRDDIFRNMVHTVHEWMVGINADVMETWIPAHEKKRIQILRSHFFIRNKRTRGFLYGAGDGLVDEDIIKTENFFFTIGDSDYLTTVR